MNHDLLENTLNDFSLISHTLVVYEIEVYLLCEILISKDTLQGQKNCCKSP